LDRLRCAEARKPRCDLHVEDTARHDAVRNVEQLEILPAGVDHYLGVRIGNELRHRCKINTTKRVHQDD
jgi:hypothetical protein